MQKNLDAMHFQQSQLNQFGWFINVSEIAPGASAIIGDNRLAFYAIHHVALCTIPISLVSSGIVMLHIYSKWRRHASKLEFPVRFPLYLAIADSLWGISHFVDHMYLVTVQRYPNIYAVQQALSMNTGFFFGYQQGMHASVAAYTYLCVVHSKKVDFGKWEWKLHLLWFGPLAGAMFIFNRLDMCGITGYWMSHDATTSNGQALGVIIALLSTMNALCTTLCYQGIKANMDKIKMRLRSSSAHMEKWSLENPRKLESVASQCLTTYVYQAACIYCPFAILLWTNVLFQIFMGVIEPLSCFFIAIVANCSGWANAYGYFHNERLKEEKRERMIATWSASPVYSIKQSIDINSSSVNSHQIEIK